MNTLTITHAPDDLNTLNHYDVWDYMVSHGLDTVAFRKPNIKWRILKEGYARASNGDNLGCTGNRMILQSVTFGPNENDRYTNYWPDGVNPQKGEYDRPSSAPSDL